MVDRPLIRRKLEGVDTYLEQIRRKKDPGLRAFGKDRDLQSIVMFNMIQAVQACVDIGAHIIGDSGWETPGSQAEIFEILARHNVIKKPLARRMIKMVGFRNRIVHEYERIDFGIVHDAWRKRLGDIETFCRVVTTRYAL
ncbi:MAG: type VII toxin-antitoxin system HepT family RNase toxin [Chloroflexota bacterium]